MKNLLKLIGIIALTAVIGFSFTACNDDDSGGQTTTGKSTGAAAGTPTLVSKTTTSIAVNAVIANNPGNQTVEYARANANSAPESGWQDSGTFSGLTPNTTYFFFARSKENATHNSGAVSAGFEAKTDDSGKNAGAAAGTPTLVDKTTTSIEVEASIATNPGSQIVEYARADSNNASAVGVWQDEGLFENLTPNTTYFFFARAKENTTYDAGAPSEGFEAKTDDSGKLPGAAAGTPTLAAKTTTSITVTATIATNPGSQTVQYARGDSSLAASAGEWQDVGLFEGLTPGTTYYFFARAKENTTHDAGAPSAGFQQATDPISKSAGAEVDAAPVVTGTVTTTITVGAVTITTNPGSQTVEYALSKTNNPAPADGWQAGTTFENFDVLSDYYVFARSKENDTHNAGTAKVSAVIKTPLAFNDLAKFTTWINGFTKPGDNSVDNPVTIIWTGNNVNDVSRASLPNEEPDTVKGLTSAKSIFIYLDLSHVNIANFNDMQFRAWEFLAGITVPNTLETISVIHWDFAGCNNIKTIILNEGLTIIGARFTEWLNSPNFTEITIPSTVHTIHGQAFNHASGNGGGHLIKVTFNGRAFTPGDWLNPVAFRGVSTLSAGNLMYEWQEAPSFPATFVVIPPVTSASIWHTPKLPGGTVNAPTLGSVTTDTIIIVAPSAPGTGQHIEYAITTTNSASAIVSWQDGLTFGGLPPDTNHYIFARAKENATHYEGPASGSLTVRTEMTGSAEGAAVSGAPTLNASAPLTTSLTVNAVTISGANPGNQTVEYGININTNPESVILWQDGTTFVDLDAETDYFVFARSKANATHTAGTAQVNTTAIRTPLAFNNLAKFTTWINGFEKPANNSVDNPVMIIWTGSNIADVHPGGNPNPPAGGVARLTHDKQLYVFLDLFHMPNITRFGGFQFANWSWVAGIKFPSSLEVVGDGTQGLLASCNNIKTIILNEGLLEIGASFTQWLVSPNFTEITIPSTVRLIHPTSFSAINGAGSCRQLARVTFMRKIPNAPPGDYVNPGAFWGNLTTVHNSDEGSFPATFVATFVGATADGNTTWARE